MNQKSNKPPKDVVGRARKARPSTKENLVSRVLPEPFSNASIIFSVLLAIVIFSVYAQVLEFEFLVCDDDVYVTKNAVVLEGLTWRGVVWAFSGPHAGNYHPLTWLSHMLDVQLFGTNPGGHHAVNVLLHAATSVVLFWALRQIAGSFWPPLVVAFLFALHPLRVESVAWVAERKDVLSAFFGILTLLFYAWYARCQGWRACWPYVGMLLAFGCGLFSKSMIVTLPCVLMLLDYWPCQRFGPGSTDNSESETRHPPRRWYFLLAEKIPLGMIAVWFCHKAIQGQSAFGALNSLEAIPMQGRMLNALVSFVAYIQDTLCPTRLAIFYPHPIVLEKRIPYELYLQAVVAGMVLLAITLPALFFWRRRPYWLVGWCWYLGTLMPVIGIVQVGTQARADRYTYLPSIGLYILFVWGGSELCQRWNRSKIPAVILTSLILTGLSAATWFQASYWRDSLTLFEHAKRVTDRNYFACNHIGVAYEQLKKPEQARLAFEESIRIMKDYDFGNNNLGIYYADKGDVKRAQSHFERAILTNPRYVDALSNLGVIYARQGRLEEAEKMQLQALEIVPNRANSYFNLGVVYIKQKRWKDAVACYQRALQLNPGLTASHLSLGIAYFNLERGDLAEEHLEQATVAAPDDPVPLLGLGELYLHQKDFDRAEQYFVKVLQLDPRNVAAQKYLQEVRHLRATQQGG